MWIALLLLFGCLPASAQDAHAQARAALEEGRADDAFALLRPMAQNNPRDAEAQNLLCRVLLSEDRGDDAVPACERAVSLEPLNAQYQLWLAHATGSKAQHASPFTALTIARHARDHFEAAARLAPNDWHILSDLGEYYVEAPAIAGGDIEKARRLLPRLMQSNPSRAHWLAGLIANNGRDYTTAETEYKNAIATGQNVPEAWVNLAGFYRHRGRLQEAEDCVHKVEQTDTAHDAVLVDAASVLREMKRDNDLAIHLLRTYLASGNRSEIAPAFAVHNAIGTLLQHNGDRAAANREYVAALALARDYAPAARSLHSR